MKIVADNINQINKQEAKLVAIQTFNMGRLIVSCEGKSYLLKFHHIVYCRAEGNYTTIQLWDNRSMLVSKCLKDIIEKLPSTHFQRIHQSFVVNLNFVESISYNEIDIAYHSASLPVSRKYKKALRSRLLC